MKAAETISIPHTWSLCTHICYSSGRLSVEPVVPESDTEESSVTDRNLRWTNVAQWALIPVLFEHRSPLGRIMCDAYPNVEQFELSTTSTKGHRASWEMPDMKPYPHSRRTGARICAGGMFLSVPSRGRCVRARNRFVIRVHRNPRRCRW